MTSSPGLLWIDTTDAYCRVGYIHAEGEVAHWQADGPNQHMEQLAVRLKAFLGAHPAPSRIAVNRGPGSFTGIRIGLATAHALSRALNVPLLGFTTFRLLDRVSTDAERWLQVVHPGRFRAYARGLNAAGQEWLPAGTYTADELAGYLHALPAVSLSAPPDAWTPFHWKTVEALPLYHAALRPLLTSLPPADAHVPLYLATFTPSRPKRVQ